MHAKTALLIPALYLLGGCAASYNRETIADVGTKLKSGGTAIVATPGDGAYGDETYAGSGSATAAATLAAFARHTSAAEVSKSCMDFTCLRAMETQFDFYVIPQILHWEDRATEWSGKPDRIEVKLSVLAPNGVVLASTVISGKSKWATLGGDHPQDLLPEPINEYVGSLF